MTSKLRFAYTLAVLLNLAVHWWVQATELPDDEEAEKTARETAAAIGMVVDNKIQAENPKTIPALPGAATYIKYTPAQQGAQVQPLFRIVLVNIPPV